MDSQSGQGASNSSDFVRKLYKMLESPQDESVVRWGNEGDSFVVLENEKFTKHILPKHFKHSNFASFVRQLNKYDFHKVRHNNEEGGASPYGPGAWEFKHPDFKMNNKDALDNIRRKAPAPRKANTGNDGELLPTQQVDMINTQLVATQQQLQQLQERYNDLNMNHTIMMQELIGVQKTVVNHEHVMQYVMNFLNTVDAQRRRESRIVNPNPFANANGVNGGTPGSTSNSLPPPEDDVPASPLQHASKLLEQVNADHMLNTRNLEQMNEAAIRMNATLTTPPPDHLSRNGGTRSSSRGAQPHSAASSSSHGYDLDTLVYPIGQNPQGIDPMYGDHVNNIPYPLPAKGPDGNYHQPAQQPDIRKKSAQFDPGWTRTPHILLVEDDGTCRRIGGKFLYSFACKVDTALDGLEAVNRLNSGAKFDLVLMDIIMPNLDGVSATHLVRQFDNATPIIAMTSNIRSDDISMYFQHGMNDVLPKPFTKEGLLAMLEKHLSHLKKNSQGLEPMAPPLKATNRSLKSEESPATSPATNSNWNSPNQLTAGSPSGSNLGDDTYNMSTSYAQPVLHAPSTQMYAPAASGMLPHQVAQRRPIDSITGGPDMGIDAKRQQMFNPSMGQIPAPHMMQQRPPR